MANSFWNFVTTFAAGTLAKAEDVNTNFSGIQTGFDAVESEIDSAIRVTNDPGVTEIIANAAARANKNIQFDSAGDLELSASTSSAAGISIDDAGGFYTGTDVEVAFQEIKGERGLFTTHDSSPFATTSGSSIPATGIPPWAKRITISFYRVSSDGTADALSIQVGDAGGLHNTGYQSATGAITGTDTCGNEAAGTAFLLNNSAAHAANSAYSGTCTIILEDPTNFNYSYLSVLGDGVAIDAIISAGSVSLDTVMTQLSLDISAGAFDAGSFSVHYE